MENVPREPFVFSLARVLSAKRRLEGSKIRSGFPGRGKKLLALIAALGADTQSLHEFDLQRPGSFAMITLTGQPFLLRARADHKQSQRSEKQLRGNRGGRHDQEPFLLGPGDH